MNKKRLNRLKILIVVTIILLIYPVSVFARYVYIMSKDAYLSSRKFYFQSDILESTNPTYTFNNWDGKSKYTVSFKLESFKNSIAKTNYDIDYTLSYTATEGISCSFSKTDSSLSEKTGTITQASGSVEECICITSTQDFSVGDIIEVDIVALGTGSEDSGIKYQKKLKAKFKFIIGNSISNYSISDTSGDDFMLFTITNPKEELSRILLEFNPEVIRVDNNNEYYRKSLNSTNYINTICLNVERVALVKDENNVIVNTTNEVIQSNFASQWIIELGAETTTIIKFYKMNLSDNYSYPILSNGIPQPSNCVLNVSIL